MLKMLLRIHLVGSLWWSTKWIATKTMKMVMMMVIPPLISLSISINSPWYHSQLPPVQCIWLMQGLEYKPPPLICFSTISLRLPRRHWLLLECTRGELSLVPTLMQHQPEGDEAEVEAEAEETV
jgi:hypothetical protein